MVNVCHGYTKFSLRNNEIFGWQTGKHSQTFVNICEHLHVCMSNIQQSRHASGLILPGPSVVSRCYQPKRIANIVLDCKQKKIVCSHYLNADDAVVNKNKCEI